MGKGGGAPLFFFYRGFYDLLGIRTCRLMHCFYWLFFYFVTSFDNIPFYNYVIRLDVEPFKRIDQRQSYIFYASIV